MKRLFLVSLVLLLAGASAFAQPSAHKHHKHHRHHKHHQHPHPVNHH